MKYLIIILFLTSCGPSYYLKKAKRNLDKAIEMGADVDSIRQVKYDTVKVETVRDSLVMQLEIDTVEIAALCDSIKKSPVRVITRLKEVFTNPIAIDTTYDLRIVAQGQVYVLPITVHILNTPENFEYWIRSDSLQLPVKTEETNVTIKTETRVPWYLWIVIAALVLIILLRR